jgi:hypothetical protein
MDSGMVIVIEVAIPIADCRFWISDFNLPTAKLRKPQSAMPNSQSGILNHKDFLYAITPGTYSRWSSHP